MAKQSNCVNILMLGGAKRVTMAGMLRKAAEGLGLHLRLFSYEISKEVPIACCAEVITGLKWRDPGLFADWDEVVGKHHIDILLPFVDGAIEKAAEYCTVRSNVWTPSQPLEVIRAMYDKLAANELFIRHSLPVPQYFSYGNLEEMSFPMIAKPRFGSASKGIKVIGKPADLFSLAQPEEFLIQEYIEKREEYTVDCYVDRSGHVICAVPRRRIEVVGGEVSVTETFHDAEVETLTIKTLGGLGLRGAITIQFLRDAADGRLMLMEINPRLGGGATCSVHAGADIPSYILRDWQREVLAPCSDWLGGVRTCRYMADTVFINGELQ